MNKLYALIGSIVVAIFFVVLAFSAELPNVQDTPLETLQYDFRGQWLPSADPAQIGPENYRVLTNLRYTSAGTLETVGGYTKINTVAASNSTSLGVGIHFKKDNPSESHIILAGADDLLYEISGSTAVPGAEEIFNTGPLYYEASGAGTPRFSLAPYGHIAHANGVESTLWAGKEMPVSAYIAVSDSTAYANPKDYTEAVNNNLATTGNVAIVGGGNDWPATSLLAHFDGVDEAAGDYTSEDGYAWTITTNNQAKLDADQKKFGLSSMFFDGTDDSATIDDNAVFYMGTGNFTVDFWVRFNAVTSDMGFFQQYEDASNLVELYWDQSENQIIFRARSASATDEVNASGYFAPATGRWYHVALIRGWAGLADRWAICIDGTEAVGVTDADDWGDIAAQFGIGETSAGDLNGWIDEFRVTKGNARWVSNFSPPSRPYSTPDTGFFVGSPRPLKGVKLYIGEANSTDSTLTVKEWNGASWTAVKNLVDNTDTGATIAQTGTVTWDSTVNTSKAKFYENRLFYWYYFEIDYGDATIYRVTMDAPWQPILDIWDGVLRQPIQFQAYKSANYEDYTVEINDPTPDYYGDLGGMTSSEHLILMFDDRMTAIKFVMIAGKENTTAATVTIYYWNGSAWSSVGTVSDTTLDTAGSTKSLGQSGVMSWNPPSIESEFRQNLFGTPGYAYKLVWSDTLTASNAQVNTVTGIPAQKKVLPFKFPAIYRDRLLLCGYTEGGQGNRVDFSMAHSPQVFNGAETSNGGENSLYFGGEEELTAGAQLYNRMGSNIFIFFVALKENETYVLTGDGPENFAVYPVSLNVGCPAPATLITAEMGFDLAADVQRHIAAWLSYTGPVIFDGAVIYQIPGLEVYFDPNSADYLGQTAIRDGIGFFDQTNGEYNIIVGTNWFAYNLRQKKWFMKHTGTGETPISAWPVRDTYGNQYVYAGLDTGFVVRLEYGTSWDGTAITQKVQTGDFWPSKNVWDMTRIRRVKLVAKRIAEAHSLRIVHYGDGEEIAITNWVWENSSSFIWQNSSTWVWDNGNYVTFVDLTGGSNNRPRIVSSTVPTNQLNWLHGLRFELQTDDSTKGFQPIAWAIEYSKERRAY